MLTEQAQRALVLLTRRADKTGDHFVLDRLDRAKDEIIRLNSDSPAPYQVRSALAHAGQVLRQRRTLLPSIRLSDVEPHDEPGAEDPTFTTTDIYEWLRTTASLNEPQRTLLLDLAVGFEVEALAAQRQIPLRRMREQVSRARKHARAAYAIEVATA
jgi:DNA-directed RNA polymerase specialized sigma24 family protein